MIGTKAHRNYTLHESYRVVVVFIEGHGPSVKGTSPMHRAKGPGRVGPDKLVPAWWHMTIIGHSWVKCGRAFTSRATYRVMWPDPRLWLAIEATYWLGCHCDCYPVYKQILPWGLMNIGNIMSGRLIEPTSHAVLTIMPTPWCNQPIHAYLYNPVLPW